jgi:DNA-binding SARP family transcriptional activator
MDPRDRPAPHGPRPAGAPRPGVAPRQGAVPRLCRRRSRRRGPRGGIALAAGTRGPDGAPLKRTGGRQAVVALAMLGPPRVRVRGAWRELPAARWVALLAFVARAEDWVRREALAALFWPDHDRHGASLNLRQTLQTIARSPAGAAFEREPTRVRWRGASDAAAFEGHLRAHAWRPAIATYGGPFLDGLDVHECPAVQAWLDAERQELHARWRTGVLALASERLGQGRAADALLLTEDLLRHDAFDETAARLLLRAAAAAGDRRRAADAYTQLVDTLAQELGATPEPETLRTAAELGLRHKRG